MNENKLKKDYQNINKKTVDYIANVIKSGDITDPKNKELINEYLKNTNYDYSNCIGEFIASLFNIDRCDMFAKDKSVTIVHARTMWWYAMYFMLHKSYREISIFSSLENIEWNENSVCRAVNRLQEEMKASFDLQYKWDIIKKMIYIDNHLLSYDNAFSAPVGYKVKVFRPRGVEIEIINE